MAGDLTILRAYSHEERYKQLIPQLELLIKDETDLIANMANVARRIELGIQLLWVGFYRVEGNQLVLAISRSYACTRP